MKRRRFLILAGTGIVTLSAPFAGCSSHGNISPAISLPHHLSQFCDSATICAIGKEWIAKSVEGNNGAKIYSLLVGDGNAVSSLKTPEEWQAWADKKISADFETGNTVVVKGWVISQTEARQCALFALQTK